MRDVILDEVIVDEMMLRGLNVAWVDSDDLYPWAVRDDRARRPVDRLHRMVMIIAGQIGLRDPFDHGLEVHHRRHSWKHDNRLSNLVALAKDAHARLHAHEKRAKRSPLVESRAEKRLSRDWWDPQAPGAVVRRDDLIGLSKPVERATSSASSVRAVQFALDERLVAMVPVLRDEVGPLDSGLPISPRARGRWDDARSRAAGVRQSVRLGCSPAEAGLVGLLVRARFDRAAVVTVLGLDAPAELVRNLLDRMIHRPAVSRAIEHWHSHRRLPKDLVDSVSPM
jgi:hypothetical protein